MPSESVDPGGDQEFCISNWLRGDAHVSLWTMPETAKIDQWLSDVSPYLNHQGGL